MPELPEVEAARRAIHDNCAGLEITSVFAPEDEKVIVGVSSSELAMALSGRKLISAKRKGKNLWLELDKRPWPVLHLGMAGAIMVQGSKSVHYKRSFVSDDEEWPPKYHKLVVELEGGVKFAFVDFRRFGRIRLQNEPTEEEPIASLGPDAFLELPEPSEFADMIRKRKKSIKAVLLDQAVFSGIGNWIADEVLYQARIHPEHPSQTLSEENCGKLHSSVSEVLSLAVRVNADSDEFPDSWLFHKRWMKKPGKMAGHSIDFITVGGRTSAYVPALQKLEGFLPKVGKRVPRKPKKKGSSSEEGGGEEDEEEEEEEEEEVKPSRGRKPSVSAEGSRSRGSEVEEESALPKRVSKPRTKGSRRRNASLVGGLEEEGKFDSTGGRGGGGRAKIQPLVLDMGDSVLRRSLRTRRPVLNAVSDGSAEGSEGVAVAQRGKHLATLQRGHVSHLTCLRSGLGWGLGLNLGICSHKVKGWTENIYNVRPAVQVLLMAVKLTGKLVVR